MENMNQDNIVNWRGFLCGKTDSQFQHYNKMKKDEFLLSITVMDLIGSIGFLRGTTYELR